MSSRVVVLLLSVVLYGSYATPIHHQQTHQVELGKNVILLCESNDNDHLFSFWHAETNDNIIIGPSNKFNKQKFKYEVLSGNLTIHGVSKNEEGIYHCVSKGVRNDNVNIRSIRMLVHENWVELNEHDPTVNHYRIAIVVISLFLLSVICFLAYRVWRDRYRHPSYLAQSEDEEEDSAEEIFTAPGTSAGRSSDNLLKPNSVYENTTISTDFTSILDTVNKN